MLHIQELFPMESGLTKKRCQSSGHRSLPLFTTILNRKMHNTRSTSRNVRNGLISDLEHIADLNPSAFKLRAEKREMLRVNPQYGKNSRLNTSKKLSSHLNGDSNSKSHYNDSGKQNIGPENRNLLKTKILILEIQDKTEKKKENAKNRLVCTNKVGMRRNLKITLMNRLNKRGI